MTESLCPCGYPHGDFCGDAEICRYPWDDFDSQAADGIHTIPVPRGWSPEQAWEAVKRGDSLTSKRPRWANVRIKDGRFVELLDAE